MNDLMQKRVASNLRVLIFTLSYGSGHTQVARSLEEHFFALGLADAVKTVDIVEAISPLSNKVILKSYLQTLRFAPQIYGRLYSQTENSNIFQANVFITKLLTMALKDDIAKFAPDVILCTHAFASVLIGNLRRKGMSIPCATIITDYTVHSGWLHPSIDRYYIALDDLRPVIEKHGIAPSKIRSLGIPVRRKFKEALNATPEELRQRLQLPDLPTILFMGGGLGLGDLLKAIKVTDGALEGYLFVVICGNNKELLQRLNTLKNNSVNQMVLFGYTELVPELMALSTLVVSKPGGVTSTEVFSLQKPLAIISPLPGQEMRNRDFFIKKGMAVSIPESHLSGQIIGALCNSPAQLAAMQEANALVGKVDAGVKIVEDIAALLSS